ncbi:MAG: signal transduction histidine kinase regulating citrate/malate metabolism, partial [Pelosinus sp.]|nr:signal transduction histidine kinase regulating citrate/malate metabolism [Pelosinus sp.]
MKRTWLSVLLMILIVPLVGELKFYPFDHEFSSFRVSFGSPIFLFF